MPKFSSPKESFVAWVASKITRSFFCRFWAFTASVTPIAVFAEFMCVVTVNLMFVWTVTDTQTSAVLDVILIFYTIYSYWYEEVRSSGSPFG